MQMRSVLESRIGYWNKVKEFDPKGWGSHMYPHIKRLYSDKVKRNEGVKMSKSVDAQGHETMQQDNGIIADWQKHKV